MPNLRLEPSLLSRLGPIRFDERADYISSSERRCVLEGSQATDMLQSSDERSLLWAIDTAVQSNATSLVEAMLHQARQISMTHISNLWPHTCDMVVALRPFADMITLDGRNESLLELLPHLVGFAIDCIDALIDMVVRSNDLVRGQQLVRLFARDMEYFIIPPTSAPIIELLQPFATDESLSEWYECCDEHLLDSIATPPWHLNVRYGRMSHYNLAYILGDQFRHSLDALEIQRGYLHTVLKQCIKNTVYVSQATLVRSKQNAQFIIDVMHAKGQRVTIDCFANEMDHTIGRLLISHLQPTQDELDALLAFSCMNNVYVSSLVIEQLLEMGANYRREIEVPSGIFVFERDAPRKQMLVLAKFLGKHRQ